MSYEREQAKTEDKVARVPFGGPQFKLQLSESDRKGFTDRGMVPRWFNDQDGKVERAKAAGYKLVDPKHVPSLGVIESEVKKVVSKGQQVIFAYLLEQTLEHFNEDQASKERRNAEVDNALALGGNSGSEVESAYKPG